IIQGVVISSDKEGNCYKYITIDDGTAGVQVKINSSSLYTNYPLGQRVFVKCDGLVLGDYGMLHQLGWWENGSMQSINTNRLSKYLFRDGLPGATPAPIELNSAYEIQGNMYNRLVKIKNCHFKYPGEVFAKTTSSGTSNEIVFSDGSEIILYTSSYAKFASQLTPEGTFDMVAILSRFRSDNQLVLRSLDDMGTPTVDPVIHEKVVYTMDLSQNPLLNGWSNTTTAGSSWEYLPSASTCLIQGMQGNNDSWLISPAINATNYDNVSLSLTHRSLNGTNGRHLYYSTSYNGGAINPADWTEIDLGTLGQGYTTFTYDIDEEIFTQPNLRFALRYTDNTNSTWLVSSFKLVSYVLE
ncbi:MAG: DUF5689 domain-containing protein, partial [Bacteroidales bacterium]|nr:DUF5689 domain-containing protein [Bacteroidales bacterium]